MLRKEAEGATTDEEIPPALRNRPILNQFQTVYWKMYRDITGSRQFTQSGVAEIPYSAKILWLDENGVFDQDERNDCLQIVTAIDSAYLEDFYKKNKP